MKAKIGCFIRILKQDFPWVNTKAIYKVIDIGFDNVDGEKDDFLEIKGVDKMGKPIQRPYYFYSDDDYEIVEGD